MLQRRAGRETGGRGGERVVDVEPPDEGKRQLDGLARRRDPHARSRRVGREDRALHITERLDPVRDDLRAFRLIREIAPVFVVAVQYRGLRNPLVGGLSQHREELAFCLEIFLQGAVEVEMLRREIGEDRDIDLRPAELAQRERVARGLEHAPRRSRDEKLGEELLHLDRFLGALTRLVLPLVVGDLEVHRGREAGLRARCFQDVGDEVDRRGLAIGSGDRGELQLAGRMIEELRRDVGQRRARIGHDSDGHAYVDGVLGDDGDSPTIDRVLHERVPVTVKARNRDEERALLHFPRVVCDLANIDRGGTFWYRDLRRFE